ncbi:hypothetical protein AB0C96_32145 [Streptomyces sp. NPDC048506]
MYRPTPPEADPRSAWAAQLGVLPVIEGIGHLPGHLILGFLTPGIA